MRTALSEALLWEILLPRGAWMTQGCTEERRAGERSAAGWRPTAGRSCSALPLLERGG